MRLTINHDTTFHVAARVWLTNRYRVPIYTIFMSYPTLTMGEVGASDGSFHSKPRFDHVRHPFPHLVPTELAARSKDESTKSLYQHLRTGVMRQGSQHHLGGRQFPCASHGFLVPHRASRSGLVSCRWVMDDTDERLASSLVQKEQPSKVHGTHGQRVGLGKCIERVREGVLAGSDADGV